MSAGGTLRRFYAVLDGAHPERTLDMLADDLRVSILFSDAATGAREFEGGRAEYDAYMAQRGAPTWTHHVLAEAVRDDVEVVLGETRRDGAQVASFVAAVQLDGAGRIRRYLVGRSPAVLFDLND